MLPAQTVPRRVPFRATRAPGLLWVATLLPGLLGAQEGTSVLSLIPTEGRTVSVGQDVEGELRASDYVSYNGNHLQAWEMRGTAGQSVVLDLLSDPLDPYLSVVGPGIDGALTNDDGGAGLNSRLCLSFSETGTYRIVASALGGRTGPYTLRVRESMDGSECEDEGGWLEDYSGLEALSTAGRSLPLEGEVSGELDADDPVVFDAPAEAWALEGRAGRSVSVDLTSDDFDAYLYLLGPGLQPIEDDDGAGACDSRISVTLPESGTYRVVASSLGAGGAYTLTVRPEPGPASDEPCGGVFEDYWDIEEADQVLRDLPLTGTLSLDRPLDGLLDAGDPVFRGAYVQVWALEGRAGQTVAVDLTSEELDTYLYLTGPGFEEAVSDDDGGEEVNSRLCVVLPETGTYRVAASTFGDEEAGPYRLLVSPVPGPGEPGACEYYEVSMESFLGGLSTAGRTLRVGGVEPGRLDASDARDPRDGSFVEAWALPLQPGEEATVDMVSGELDAYLLLAGPGIEGFRTDDDGAGACNARLTFTASEGGTYRVVAGSISSGASGSYELHVTRQPGPEHDGPCPSGMDMGFGEPDEAELLALPVMGTISPGYDHEDMLSDGDPLLADGYAHAWELRGSAGESFVVELISEEFDSYLFMTGPGVGLLSDDDDAGSLDSRIEITLPETGTYRIVVTTFGDYGTGAYRLRILRSR